MEDGPDLQVHGLEAAEGALDLAQTLVGGHRPRGIELARGQAGTHDVQTVQGGLAGDGFELAPVTERPLGDLEVEVIGHFVLADHLADPQRDFLLALQAALSGLRRQRA